MNKEDIENFVKETIERNSSYTFDDVKKIYNNKIELEKMKHDKIVSFSQKLFEHLTSEKSKKETEAKRAAQKAKMELDQKKAELDKELKKVDGTVIVPVEEQKKE